MNTEMARNKRDEALRELRQDLRQGEILEAAKEIFATTPFEEISMARIAEAAGVSRSTLYVYFTNKDALLRGIFEHGQENFTRELEYAMAGAESFRERLEGVVTGIIRFLSDHHALYQKVISPSFQQSAAGPGSQALVETTQRSREFLRAILRSGIDEGILPEHDVVESSWVLETILHGTVGPRLADPDFPVDVPNAARLTCEYLLAAIQNLAGGEKAS